MDPEHAAALVEDVFSDPDVPWSDEEAILRDASDDDVRELARAVLLRDDSNSRLAGMQGGERVVPGREAYAALVRRYADLAKDRDDDEKVVRDFSV